MNKVICDVCGTDYPETAAQCPICGCARADGGQTSAGNTSGEETTGYTYVKGGRFSRSNVKKRLKANQMQQAALEQSQRLQRQNEQPDDDEYEDDDDELEEVSNKGLIVIIILLLLAIIAVTSYIAVTFFGDRKPNTDQTRPTQSDPDITPTAPSDREGIPCTGLTLNDRDIMLVRADAPWELDWSVEPADTTDAITFLTSDPTVATVDANGMVTAVGNGVAVISVRCGDFEGKCTVTCELDADDPTEPSDPTDPSQTEDPSGTEDTAGPTEPTDVTEPGFELNRDDFTLFFKGDSWRLYNGDIDPDQITWSSDDEAVATVDGGKVVAVGPGRTTIRAVYDGQEQTCKVSCSFEVEGPTEPSDPTEGPTDPTEDTTDPTEDTTDPTEDTTAPTEAPETHALLVNGSAPSYQYEGKANSADISLKANGDADTGSCTVSISGAGEVQWENTDPAVCSIDSATGKVTALAAGRATLTAVVDGVEYIVVIRVSE